MTGQHWTCGPGHAHGAPAEAHGTLECLADFSKFRKVLGKVAGQEGCGNLRFGKAGLQQVHAWQGSEDASFREVRTRFWKMMG